MGEELMFDFKLALASLEDIRNEWASNQEITEALIITIEEIKKAILLQGDVQPRPVNFKITKLYGLIRTRISLSLVRSVNAYGLKDSKVENAISKIINIVEEKINKERELEEIKNEKNSRR